MMDLLKTAGIAIAAAVVVVYAANNVAAVKSVLGASA